MNKKIIKWMILGIISILIILNLLIGIFIDWDFCKVPWNFISDQVLGMKWLDKLIHQALFSIFDQTIEGTWQFTLVNSLQFFIYDFIKITILLCVLIFIISYVQSYFPPERTKKILGKFHGLRANIIGALLGTVTPFCSCSSIPIFIGFTRAGLSSGVTFSFLISSPLVDLGSLMLLVGFFGWKVAISYVVIGLVLAVIGGTIMEKTKLGRYVEDFVSQGGAIDLESINLSIKDRIIYAKDQVLQTYKKVVIYIIIGVGIGALIHNVIPQAWVENILGGDKWYGVPLAAIIGAPIYADIFGTLPIAEALYTKGAGLGTILAFMMSVTALSLPSLIMLRKAVKPKLLFGFIAIVVIGIIIIGYTFNMFEYLFI